MRILALDMATKTGWAHSCGVSGVWDLSILRDESSGMRLIRFMGKLEEIQKHVGVDLIVFEAVSAGQGPRANLDVIKLCSKLQAIVEQFCVIHGVSHCSRNIQEIKSHALPPMVGKAKKGERDKGAMIEAAEKKWPGREFFDENEVDACWLLDLVMKELCEKGGFEDEVL